MSDEVNGKKITKHTALRLRMLNSVRKSLKALTEMEHLTETAKVDFGLQTDVLEGVMIDEVTDEQEASVTKALGIENQLGEPEREALPAGSGGEAEGDVQEAEVVASEATAIDETEVEAEESDGDAVNENDSQEEDKEESPQDEDEGGESESEPQDDPVKLP